MMARTAPQRPLMTPCRMKIKPPHNCDDLIGGLALQRRANASGDAGAPKCCFASPTTSATKPSHKVVHAGQISAAHLAGIVSWLVSAKCAMLFTYQVYLITRRDKAQSGNHTSGESGTPKRCIAQAIRFNIQTSPSYGSCSLLSIRLRKTYGIRCMSFAALVRKGVRFATPAVPAGYQPDNAFDCRFNSA